jgi:hypothetical protein
MLYGSSLAAPFPLHTLHGFFVLATFDGFFPLTKQVGGRISQRCTALLEVPYASIGLALDAPANLLARLRRNHHANADADANTEQKAPQYVSVHCSFATVSNSNPRLGSNRDSAIRLIKWMAWTELSIQ